jgi:Putative death-receptor fusion protein (DUF2428)
MSTVHRHSTRPTAHTYSPTHRSYGRSHASSTVDNRRHRRLQVLLAGGLRRLLDMAGSAAGCLDPDTPPEPWPRVHALNMLRMAFSERGLALDGSAFLAEGAQGFWRAVVGLKGSKQRARPGVQCLCQPGRDCALRVGTWTSLLKQKALCCELLFVRPCGRPRCP